MAIDYNSGTSLDAGASDITYSGNEGPKSPQQMASMEPSQQSTLEDIYEKLLETMSPEDATIKAKEIYENMGSKGQGGMGDMAGGEYNRVLKLLEKVRENRPLSEEEKIELRELIKTLSASKQNEGIGNMAMKSGLIDDYRNYKMQQQEIDPSKLMSPRDWHESEYGAARAGVAYGGTANPTYTQSRKQRMAYGGVAGLDGRKRYGIGSWFQEKKDKVVNKVADLIPNEIKDNKALTAALVGSSMLIPGVGPMVQAGLGKIGSGIMSIPGVSSIPGVTQLGQLGSQALTGMGNLRGAIGTGATNLMNKIPGVNIGGEYSTTRPSGIDAAVKQMTGGGINPLDSNWQEILKQQAGNIPSGMDRIMDIAVNRTPLGQSIAGFQDDQSLLSKAKDFGIDTLKNVFLPSGPETGTGTGQGVNWKDPVKYGLMIGALESQLPKAQLPTDTSGIDMASAIRGDNLRFRPRDEVLAAQGGRIGYAEGTDKGPLYVDPNISYEDFPLTEFERDLRYTSKEQRQEKYNELLRRLEGMTDEEKKELLHYGPQPYGSGSGENVRALEYTDDPVSEEFYETGEHFNKGGIAQLAQGGRIGYQGGGDMAHRLSELIKKANARTITPEEENEMEQLEIMLDYGPGEAQGGRIGRAEGGLMNLGGMEKDYRAEGGFVPIGGQEKADDVPARLSKNEFVFTADAVRAAGGGDIDQGAEIMENLMNNLEQGGQVSEDSQGLEGARDMFATAQRLEGVM